MRALGLVDGALVVWNSTMHRLTILIWPIVLVLSATALSGCNRASRDEQSDVSTTDAAEPTHDSEPDLGKTTRFTGHTASIRFVTFSTDGRRALTGSSGQVFEQRDGKLEAKAADDRSARVWDVATGRQLARFNEHADGVACGALSPDGSIAATADGAVVRVWTVSDKPEQKYEFKESQQPIVAMTFSSNGRRLAAAGEDQFIRLWDTSSGQPLGAWKTTDVATRGLAFSPDDKYLCSASSGGVEVWDAAELLPVRELREVSPLEARFSADSKRLLMLVKHDASTRSPDGVETQHYAVALHEWDLGSGEMTSHDPLISPGVEQAALAPDGSKFVVIDSPLKGYANVHVYDVAKKKEVTGIEVAHSAGDAPKPGILVAISPNGRMVAIAAVRDKSMNTVELHELTE
jgi:WD40 repeat protein